MTKQNRINFYLFIICEKYKKYKNIQKHTKNIKNIQKIRSHPKILNTQKNIQKPTKAYKTHEQHIQKHTTTL